MVAPALVMLIVLGLVFGDLAVEDFRKYPNRKH